MDHDAPSNPSKRAPSPTLENDAVTPATVKRRKIDDVANQSPSTPKALNAIASAISGVFGYGKQAINGIQQPSAGGGANNPLGTSPSMAMMRPAIKLAALRGTKWDDGSGNRSPKPKKTTPKKTPRSNKSQTTPRAGSPSDRTPSKSRPTPLQNDDGGYDFFENESPAGKNGAAKRLWGGSASSPAPKKGILTPTKKRGRPPKNVSFGRLAGEVFFEDLPKKRKPKAKEVDEDEIVCEICSKAHSKAPNEIILCDNCDFAVHQECYEVPEIPEGDWLCKSCAQEDVLKGSVEASKAVEAPTLAADTLDIPNLTHHLRHLQRVLLDRCTGRRRIKMFGQEEAHEKTRQIVEQTVLAGEGNSMLIVGPRGCGKTTMLENIVQELSTEHRQDFHVVRLNGFVHTDDKLALKEIWRQLGKEMEVDDDLVNRTNYADTMASLLALLSHPSEIMGTGEGVTSQSIIFIIDEFDMFASHPRQTLLYNLFDVAQSRKAPIAVLGCTTRLDVVEMLEKRVKSRFSHRYVYMSLPKTLPAYWQVCRQGLLVEREDAVKEGIDQSLEGYEEFWKYWSHKIEALYKERSFQDLLQFHYYTTKSTSAFFTEWILPLSSLSSSNLTLTTPQVNADMTSLAPPDSHMHLLAALSDLDLGLLIAAARLDIIAHTDTVNFAMAYDEYSSLIGRQRVQSATSGMLAAGGGARVWGRGVAGIAWERLVSLGLVVPYGSGGGRAAAALGHGGLEGKMCRVDVALEEIPAAAKLSQAQARWCREI